VVPIIDLRRRFNLEPIDFGPTTVVIVLRIKRGRGAHVVGMVVDAVSEVYNVGAAETKAPPDICGSIDTVFVKALATVENKMLILLDVDRLIGSSVSEDMSPGAAAA
jgi:purine-binding chemotaxis protein CheW